MAHITNALARLRRDPSADLSIDQQAEQLLDAEEDRRHPRRNRLLPARVTLRLFLLQILHGNIAITALRQLTGINFAPSSYCEARGGLTLHLLQSLMSWIGDMARAAANRCGTLGTAAPRELIGPRVLIADGSSHSMSDTPPLREHFDLPTGQIPGVGYPAGKLMGLLDAATGMFVSLLALPLFQHDMRAVIGLHPMLQPGDILLGDRALCGFAHVALLNARGVFACFRLHQRRKIRRSRGTDRWLKPKKAPAWMDETSFAALPLFVDVRIVSYGVTHKGFRTKQVVIATTLMDEQQWPDAKIAELYGMRWDIEICFDHLKTTMGMNVLHCRTVQGVMKELAMYLIAYNLIRLAMLRAAAKQGVSARRISFVDAMRFLCATMLGLPGVAKLMVNPRREARTQLRVIRRRWKEYDLLKRPRREEELKRAGKQGENG